MVVDGALTPLEDSSRSARFAPDPKSIMCYQIPWLPHDRTASRSSAASTSTPRPRESTGHIYAKHTLFEAAGRGGLINSRGHQRSRHHNLLIGIDADQGQINGCVNTVDAVQRLLIERRGIDPASITSHVAGGSARRTRSR
jgi:hypothetical protein